MRPGHAASRGADASTRRSEPVVPRSPRRTHTRNVGTARRRPQDYLTDVDEIAACAQAWTAAGTVRYVG